MNNLTDLRKAAEMYPELNIGDDFNVTKILSQRQEWMRPRYRDLPLMQKKFCEPLCCFM